MKQVLLSTHERFQWAKQLFSLLKKQFSNDGVSFYEVAAAHADIKNRNNRIYTSDELKNSASSLSDRPLNINHDPRKTLPYPENQVIVARYENGVVECIIQVADPKVNEMIESGEISKVSIEGLYLDESKNTGDTEYPTSLHFKALALLTSEDEPGDPLTEIIKDHRQVNFLLDGEIRERISFLKEAPVATFQTSGEDNVCADMDGNTYPTENVPDSALPPIHPNCACALIQSVHDGRLVKIKKVRIKMTDKMQEDAWSSSMQNDLPDDSFAYISAGGMKDEQGKTTPRSLRHFPYKDASGKIDPAHVRNGLARLSQSAISPQGKAAARKELVAAANKVGIQTSMDEALPRFRQAWEDYRIAKEFEFSILEGMGLAQPESSNNEKIGSPQDFDGTETAPKKVNPDEQTKKQVNIERDIPSTGVGAPSVKSLQPVGGQAPDMEAKSVNPEEETNGHALPSAQKTVMPKMQPNLEAALKNSTPNGNVTSIPHVNEKTRKPIRFTVSK